MGDLKIDPNDNWYQKVGNEMVGKEKNKLAKIHELESTGMYIAQPKRDGIFGSAFSENSRTRAFSRNRKEKTGHGLPDIGQHNVIIGELGMGQEETVIRKKKYGHSFMDVFDILFLKGKYVGSEPMLKRAIEIVPEWHNTLPTEYQKYFIPIPTHIHGFVDLYLKEKEGIVIKKKDDGEYKIGGINYNHTRIKKKYDFDMVILGWNLSDAETKSYTPMARSVIVGQYFDGKLIKMGTIGGIPNQVAIDIAENFENKYRNQVVVATGYRRFESGAIRHGSWWKLRDDKDPKDCIFDSNGWWLI